MQVTPHRIFVALFVAATVCAGAALAKTTATGPPEIAAVLVGLAFGQVGATVVLVAKSRRALLIRFGITASAVFSVAAFVGHTVGVAPLRLATALAVYAITVEACRRGTRSCGAR